MVSLAATAALCLPVVTLAAVPASASGDGDFRIADERITESSGLALSRAHPHTVWTANDSGDTARVFAVDTRTGLTVGVHRFGAPVWDVEALALDTDGRLLVGDLGDNTSSRKVARIFWFDEPALGETSGSWASWEVAYPDGPHDAEALAVHPRTGRVYVVTKGRNGGGVYALPEKPSRTGVNRLERVAPAPAMVTDAVFLTDGSGLVVRTYTRAVLLDADSFLQVASDLLPLQPQGETVALAPGGRGLLVGSEGQGSVVQRVPVPRRPRPTPQQPTLPSGPSNSIEVRETPLDFSTLAAGPSLAQRAREPVGSPAGAAGAAVAVLALMACLGLAVRQARRKRAGRH